MTIQNPFIQALRWIFIPFEVFGAFVLTGIVMEVPVRLFNLWEDVWTGIACAFIWVLIAYLAAPARKGLISSLFLILGIMLAWKLLHSAWIPEGHAKAYQPTNIPLISTISSGCLTWIALLLLGERKNNNPTKK